VRLRDDSGTLTVEVEDDGTGPSSTGREASAGMGLAGMRERAEALGGTLTAGPGPGGGFRIVAVLPHRTDELLP
jgi:signal transduction histidine kinase